MNIKDVIKTQEQATAKFDTAVQTSEQKMFDEVVLLIKDLKTNTRGTILPNIDNLKTIQKIRAKLSKIANNKAYLSAVRELVNSFDTIYNEQLACFARTNQTDRTAEKYRLVKTIARENTIAALTGAGLTANVTKQLDQMLLRAVTTAEKFTDLQEELRQYLLSNENGQGALARYAKTYAVTAISQYAGQNNKLFTEDLGTDWFEYVGSEIETTRPFCDALLKKRYVHRSEIHQLLKGHIHIPGGEDIDVPLYDKTGLPHGMIEGTNEENFQVCCGGWNCRHQLIPIADAVVPKNIREEIEKVQNTIKEAERLRKSGDYNDIQTNSRGGLKAIHKGHIVHSAHKEQTFFEDNLTSTQLELACQNQLYQQGHRVILRDESAQDNNGNKLPALDLELDGKMMDIASVTKGTCGSALLNKNKQANRCLQELGVNCDTICLYYHDSSMFSEERLKKDIAWYYEHVTAYHHIAKLKKIIVVVKGNSDISEYDI